MTDRVDSTMTTPLSENQIGVASAPTRTFTYDVRNANNDANRELTQNSFRSYAVNMENATDRPGEEFSTLGSWEKTRVEAGPPAPVMASAPRGAEAHVVDSVEDRLLGDDRSARPTLGRFELLRQIGSGAMGVVYEGYDPELDRRVALKVLRADAAARDALHARSRMMREARALARLRHPHVTMIFEVGTSEKGAPFIAMELVEGRTLKSWLRSRPRCCREVLEVFIQAGRGLAAAHAAGLVHRDFKPDNVIIDEEGQARVVDFGLARTAGLGELMPTLDEHGEPEVPLHLTSTGAVLGTPAYMAPEQFEGSAVEPSSDQFSFCVALFEALYGRRPYPGDDLPSLQRSLIGGKPVGPRRGVPRKIYRVLRRGLSTEATERYPSMEALLDALSACTERPKIRRPMVLVAGLAAAVAASLWMPQAQAPQTSASASAAAVTTPAPVVARAAGPGRSWAR